MLGAVALLLPVSAALGIGFASETADPDRAALGSGIAGVRDTVRSHLPRVLYRPGGRTERELGGGEASYYGNRFAGKRTASGERFDPRHLTAAHRSLPFGSKVRVTSRRTGRSVVVRINDRGPFHRARIIDLSEAAAQRIGMADRGRGRVYLALLDT